MFYREYSPSILLQSFIDRYWIVETYADDLYPMLHNLTPNGMDGLVIHYACEEALCYIRNGSADKLPSEYLLVQPQTSWKLQIAGSCGIAGVFFKPGALQYILRYPMAEISGQPVDLEALTGQSFRQLSRRLHDVAIADKIDLLNTFFLHQFNDLFSSYPNHVQRAVSILTEQNGNLTINQLAGNLGISRQLLSRQFAEQVGVSPKQLGRIIRFNALHRFLARQPKTRWVDLTYAFGYFDQSHFIKDFQEFMGMLPTEYIRSSTEMADFYSGK
jgi:AraC-like DNA-binding protein